MASKGITNVIPSAQQLHLYATVTEGSADHLQAQHQGPIDRLKIFFRKAKAVIKTILENSESRRIYFFLCLNLAYMLVQMMYVHFLHSVTFL